MRTGNVMCRLFTLILTVAMLFNVAGCGDSNNQSELPELNYGDEVINDLASDIDSVTIETEKNNSKENSSGSNKGNNGSSSDKQVANSSNKNNTAASYNDSLDRNHKIDENEKKTFLDSVPDKLKGQEVSILVWWNPFEYETKKMEKFTEATGIKIKWIYVDQDSYVQRLASLRAQGNAPDIAGIRVSAYPSSIIQGYFRPLSASKLDLSKTDVFDIDSMNQLKWEGKHYGAIIKGTTYITMGLLMYNADLFDKHGVTTPHKLWQDGKWNWDTFISTSQAIQKKSNITACTAGYHGYRLAQTGGEDAVAIKNGKIVNNMSSKVYRDAYKWVANLNPKGQYKVLDWSLNRDGFMAGNAAMLVEDSWALQAGERFNNLSFTLGYAPLPCKSTQTVVPSDAQLWGFPDGSKHLEAASYALEYWQDPAYNETGYEIWLNDSVAGFMDWLWKQPKTFKVSQGVVEYGGDYSWWTYNMESTANKNTVDSVMDKWSAVVDTNIKKIYTEFGS